MMRTKILLDTDIGTDIDDAVCLAYLLMNPQCDLLGITTVTGEADKRAQLASALCKRAGKDVPIYVGSENPLLVPQGQPVAQQAAALAGWPYEKTFPSDAIEFMRRAIRDNPGEVTLLTIAPLTNIGLLFAVDPEIPSLLKGLVMMCGLLGEPPKGYGPREWNAMCDPHATAIVYRASVRQHRSIGLDVTHKVAMSRAVFRTAFGKFELFDPILEWAEIWFEKYDATIFHDPLAAATIFDDSLCSFQRGNIETEWKDESTYGAMRFQHNPNGNHEIADGVDPQRFFDHFIGTFKK
jgi:inosine-uridine nucleoside N-ribohydrolase